MRKTESDVIPEGEEPAPSPTNVRLFPTFKEIPEPDLPLDVVGRPIYYDWCRKLLERGLLTMQARESIQMLALAKQGMTANLTKGKPVTRQNFDMYRAATIQLSKLDVDQNMGEATGQGNIYETFGFARRERKARFGK